MKQLICRIILFCLVSVPFMGCSQNNPITPVDSVEVLPVTQLFLADPNDDSDSLKIVRCNSFLSFETGDYGSEGLMIFSNDSVFTKFIDQKSLEKRPDLYGYLVKGTNHTLPRICTDAQKVNYDRNLQTFIALDCGTYIDLKNYQLVLKADHQRKVYSFQYTLNIKTNKGIVRLGKRYVYNGFLTPKLDPSYQIEYVINEKFIP